MSLSRQHHGAHLPQARAVFVRYNIESEQELLVAGGHLATHRRRSRRAIDDRFVGSLLTLGFRDRWSSTEVVECRTLDVSGRGS
ncbi:MAG: hypothetical protein VX427_18440, partial [Acidobacteriota bacterium]|nr:hypothetical protein [Acidobacteriota bacterium]